MTIGMALLLLVASVPAEAHHRSSSPPTPPAPSANLVYAGEAIAVQVCAAGVCTNHGEAMLTGSGVALGASRPFLGDFGAGSVNSSYGTVMANWPGEPSVAYGDGKAYAVTFADTVNLAPEVTVTPASYNPVLQVIAGVSQSCTHRDVQAIVLRASFFGQPIPDIFVWYGENVNGMPNQTFTANGATLILNEQLADGTVIGLHLIRANGEEVKIGVVTASVSGCS